MNDIAQAFSSHQSKTLSGRYPVRMITAAIPRHKTCRKRLSRKATKDALDAEVNSALHNYEEAPGKRAYRQKVLDSWNPKLDSRARSEKKLR